MRFPTYDEEARQTRAWGGFPAAFFLVVALSVIAPAIVFFWPDYKPPAAATDPEIIAALQEIGAGQLQTVSQVKAINTSLAAERADLKLLSDQFSALTARLNTLQEAGAQILRDNAE